MAHFHQRRRTRIRIPNPIVTLYHAQLFPLVWIQIWIPVQIVSRMITVPILGMDLRPRDPNPNPSPLVEMSHDTICIYAKPWLLHLDFLLYFLK